MSNFEGLITENIADTIRPGLIIYDVEATKVGSVEMVDLDAGWFTATTDSFPDPARSLYLPFSLITNIDPHDLFVSRTRDELLASYTTTPPRTVTTVENGPSETAITYEVSGYGGEPIEVDRAQIDSLKAQIAVGQSVCTSDMTNLGTIKQYDAATGWMLIERGILAGKHDIMVPVTVVDSVDTEVMQVYLSVTQDDLQRMQRPNPADVVFVQAQVTNSK